MPSWEWGRGPVGRPRLVEMGGWTRPDRPAMQFRVQQARADERFGAYVGWGAPQPGRYADAALTATAAASEGLTVQYAWPTQAPVVLLPDLEIGGLLIDVHGARGGCDVHGQQLEWCHAKCLGRGGICSPPHKLFHQGWALMLAPC